MRKATTKPQKMANEVSSDVTKALVAVMASNSHTTSYRLTHTPTLHIAVPSTP
jgi:hypothetical protein